ncbi:MAG: hypothetical protein ACFE8N_01590 [Promethearchaeota archaeon]
MGKMIKAYFSVPPGFVVKKYDYRDFLLVNDHRVKMERKKRVKENEKKLPNIFFINLG